MIEFRYHVVSLIAVFLALAVGIVLGAGPLKEAIGDQLTGQVEQLREEKAALRTELDAANHGIENRDAFIDATAKTMIGGLLDSRRVAIVTIDQPSDAVVTGVRDRLVQAGATVTAQVEVANLWTDPAQRAFRESLSGSLLTYLSPRPQAAAGFDAVLGEALGQGLTSSAAGSVDTLTDEASLELDLLRESKLISGSEDVTTPADDIVIILGPTVRPETEQPDLLTERRTTLVALVAACFRASRGLVVVGDEPDESSLVDAIRSDAELERTITTVESIASDAATVTVPLALANRVNGTVGHFGFDDGDTAVAPPRVKLAPVVRAAAEAPKPSAAPTESAG